MYASIIWKPDQPFIGRDIDCETLEGTDGSTIDNMQYMLKLNLNWHNPISEFLNFLHWTKKPVILITLDYTGLSTNLEDLKDFIQ